MKKSNKKIGFAIIGTGGIARQHALAIQENAFSEIVAVCNIHIKKAQDFGREFGVTKIYSDYRDVMNDSNVDAVAICTPSGLHGEICIAAAKAGKHILCEKPIEIKKEKLDALIKTVEDSHVKMECIYQTRFAPLSIKMKEALESGVFGKVLMASVYLKYYRTPEYYQSADWRATWEYDGGGCLMNQGIHGIDLINWLMGGVKRVSAFTKTQMHNIEVEDVAVAAVEFKNGALGVIEGSVCCKPAQNMRIEIYCENGSMCFHYPNLLKWNLNGEEKEYQINQEYISNDDPMKNLCNQHGIQVDNLVKSILNDSKTTIEPREARKAVDIILAIYESSREKKEICL